MMKRYFRLSVFAEDPGLPDLRSSKSEEGEVRGMNAFLAAPDSAKKLRASAVAWRAMADTSARRSSLLAAAVYILFAAGGLAEVNAGAVGKPLEITGKVRVLRNESDNKVREINVVTEDGKTYGVVLDANGKKLTKILKSRIVKVTGELRGGKDKNLLVVHKSEIIGIAKKPDSRKVVAAAVKPEPGVAVNSAEKPEPKVVDKPAEKPEVKVVMKPVEKIEAGVTAKPAEKPEVKITAKPESKIEVEAETRSFTNTDAEVSVKIESKTEQSAVGESATNSEARIESQLADALKIEEKTNAVEYKTDVDISVLSNAVFFPLTN